MGVLIGTTDANSTWGKNRTPIFRSTHGATGAGSASFGHNLTANDGWGTENYTYFRCSQHWTRSFWTDSSGNIRTQWNGPFAFPAPPFPPNTGFLVGAFDPDMAEFYAPNYLDDVEVQASWVGRNVVIDAATYTMSYSALNGVMGSFQTITPSASVISFDL